MRAPRLDPCREPWAPEGVLKASYVSDVDGREDWAMIWPGERADAWAVNLHGHGSHGDQIFTREDVRTIWLPYFRELGLGVIAPNLRDNAWMSPAASDDLHALLTWVRVEYGAEDFYLVSGSMGGTGSLIYASVHPEDVTAVSARCPATDLASYCTWLAEAGQDMDVHREILDAIVMSYGGSPDEVPEPYAAQSAVRNAHRLTMPVLVVHGDADAVIPVEQPRMLAEAMGDAPNFEYVEIPGGDHEAPLTWPGSQEWLGRHVRV